MAIQTLAAQQVRERFLLRHGRVREDLCLRFIGGARHAHARNHIIFGGFRVTYRFDIEYRLIRWTGEQQLAFTHNQILTVGMEAPFRNIDLSIEAKPLLILRHFQVTRESRLQPKRVQTHVIPHVHDKITIDRYASALLFNRFQIFIEHNFITGDANRAFRHFVNHDARPRYVNTAVQGEETRRCLKDHVWRHVQAHHRRYRDTHPAALGRNTGAPVVELAPVCVTAQVDLSLLRQH